MMSEPATQWHLMLHISPISGALSPSFLCRPTAFFRLAGAVGRQSALHKENSIFAAPTLGRHISTFCGYQILFSIRNPYINRFTNHFSIHSQPSYHQKVVLHSITARFCLRPYHFAIWHSLFLTSHGSSKSNKKPSDCRGISEYKISWQSIK
jgi:hypothetical protein